MENNPPWNSTSELLKHTPDRKPLRLSLAFFKTKLPVQYKYLFMYLKLEPTFVQEISFKWILSASPKLFALKFFFHARFNVCVRVNWDAECTYVP